jgi:hypothetical protein
MDIKRETGEDQKLADHLLAIKRPEYWNSHPVSVVLTIFLHPQLNTIKKWHQPPPEPQDIYIFPEKDLMDSLMSCGSLYIYPCFLFQLPCSSVLAELPSLYTSTSPSNLRKIGRRGLTLAKQSLRGDITTCLCLGCSGTKLVYIDHHCKLTEKY